MKLEDEIQSYKFENETHKAVVNILFTAGFLRQRVYQVLKTYDLSHEQFNILRILRGQKKQTICMTEIASRMLDKNSNVTRIMNKLEHKELALKFQSKTDKREIVAEITETGLLLLSEIDGSFEELKINQLPLTELECAQLNILLDKLRDCK
jgi:DNA-binding MarR family transcriptional regulator